MVFGKEKHSSQYVFRRNYYRKGCIKELDKEF